MAERLSPEIEAERYSAWQDHHAAGKSKAECARYLGISENTFREWLRGYLARRPDSDPAIRSSMEAIGTYMVPQLAWSKTRTRKDGTQQTDYSVLLKPPELPDDTLDRIRDAFNGLKAAKPARPPKSVRDNLISVWPVMDMHFGMHSWGRETGGPDYDVDRARADVEYAAEKVLALAPQTKQAVLILGGDTLHADDGTNMTPQSGHALDVDGRHYRVVDKCIEALAYLVGRIAESSESVKVRVLRGNHDMHSHMILTFALAQRYRDDPRIEVERDPRDLFMHQWGRCSIFAHHGDKANPERMALQIADVCPFWSETRHRYAFTGHVHHDQAKDIGGLRWESLRAFCPPDSYAASMGFTARRALQVVIMDKNDGIVLRASDPIDRPA